jgi:CDP-6-deoxy-D-xylo-4-hexulose-3-dehydrase
MTAVLAPPRYPLAQITYDDAEIEAVLTTLKAGRTTMGPLVAKFERDFAAKLDAEHAVMVNSGSTADLLAALTLGPPHRGRSGYLDEILVPAVTWPTQVWGCVLAGYRVRLVDTDPETLQLDVRDAEAKLSRRTAAIFPVHVLGNVGDMGALTWLADQHGVPLLEDCCEALGATWHGRSVGTFGRAAAFSFFFSHLLSTMEGGMVTCRSEADARLLRLRRSHGWEPQEGNRFAFPTWGLNVRPMEVQGAFGLAQLPKVDRFLLTRRLNYAALAAVSHERYPQWLQGVKVLPGCEPAWHGFPLMVRHDVPGGRGLRDALCRYLEGRGVETRPLIAGNLARQPGVLKDERVIAGPLPGADLVDDHACYIGLSSLPDAEGVELVGSALRDFFEGGKRA